MFHVAGEVIHVQQRKKKDERSATLSAKTPVFSLKVKRIKKRFSHRLSSVYTICSKATS